MCELFLESLHLCILSGVLGSLSRGYYSFLWCSREFLSFMQTDIARSLSLLVGCVFDNDLLDYACFGFLPLLASFLVP